MLSVIAPVPLDRKGIAQEALKYIREVTEKVTAAMMEEMEKDDEVPGSAGYKVSDFSSGPKVRPIEIRYCYNCHSSFTRPGIHATCPVCGNHWLQVIPIPPEPEKTK